MTITNKHITATGWAIIALCLFGSIGMINIDVAEWMGTALVMCLLAYYNKIGALCYGVSIAFSYCSNNAEAYEEFISLAATAYLAYKSRSEVFYYMVALALGKVWDGVQSPWKYAPSELIWDIGCTILLILYYYDQWKKKRQKQPLI